MAKIDPTILEKMLNEEGKSQTECATFFGVSQAAISKQLKNTNIAVKKHVAQSIVMYEILRGFCEKGWL